MTKLLGYEISESITQNKVQLMMSQIMCNPTQMRAILELDDDSDVLDQQLRINVLQAFHGQLEENLPGLSEGALALFTAEVARLQGVFGVSPSPHGFHKHTHDCPCSDFSSALAAQNYGK